MMQSALVTAIKDDICTICCNVVVAFRCNTLNCKYNLCSDCVQWALSDHTNQTCDSCPSCATTVMNHVCSKDMVTVTTTNTNERKCIIDAFHAKHQHLVTQHHQCVALQKVTAEAKQIFHKITQDILLKCPHCQTVCDGGNDAYNRNDSRIEMSCKCGASFCGICLSDCESKEHLNMRLNPGGLFETELLQDSRRRRVEEIVSSNLQCIADKSDELIQLVNNKIQNSGLLRTTISVAASSAVIETFLSDAKHDLETAVLHERLSLLNNPGPITKPLTKSMISPRNSIPSGYQVRLFIDEREHVKIALFKRNVGHKEDEGWKRIPLKGTNDCPVIDSLINLAGSISCAVVAIAHKRCLYQTFSTKNKPMRFHTVDENGHVGKLCSLFGSLTVLGLIGNKRITKLQSHVASSSNATLMIDPIRHFIGANHPKALLDAIGFPVPESIYELNEQQRRVAHPLRVQTAMEVAGPPGTGKTKTITELTRSILGCTEYNIIVLSERNGAIDAIAEKFAQKSLIAGDIHSETKQPQQQIADMELWNHIMTYGSSGMGNHSKLFSLEEKVKSHPHYVPMRKQELEQEEVVYRLASQQMDYLNQILRSKFPHWKGTVIENEAITRNKRPTPTDIIDDVTNTLGLVEKTLACGFSDAHKMNKKTRISTVKMLMDQIAMIPYFRFLQEHFRANDKRNSIDQLNGDVTRANVANLDLQSSLLVLKELLQDALQHSLFSRNEAEAIVSEYLRMKATVEKRATELESDLRRKSKLHMSTIGSMGRLPFYDDECSAKNDKKIDTVVLFDEGGCIPSYELLGLSRLDCNIVCLVVVGDVHQLPPYSPGSGSWNRQDSSSQSTVQQKQMDQQKQSILLSETFRNKNLSSNSTVISTRSTPASILDASNVSTMEARLDLMIQYRVPRDIAELLNRHIYNGKYQTAVTSKGIPDVGLHFIHVPIDRKKSTKANNNCRREKIKNRNTKQHRQQTRYSCRYINHGEIDVTMDLIRRSQSEGHSSILVLTPYKNQQREIQFRLAEEFNSANDVNIPVLTIDQCQGQEADIIILTLVKKPTLFLNRHRFNVALSRVRQKLYFLVDKNQFQDAAATATITATTADNKLSSTNVPSSSWDCKLLASEILVMANTNVA